METNEKYKYSAPIAQNAKERRCKNSNKSATTPPSCSADI